MKARIFVLTTFFLFIFSTQAWSSGPMGHFLMANYTINAITNGSLPAPPDLVKALQTPEGRKAFAGGAVALKLTF